MTITIGEVQDDLNNAIDNLRDGFEDFDFQTKDNLTVSDLDQIDGFEKFAVEDSVVIEFDDFKRKVQKSLYSIDGDAKKSDFDWDDIANYYDEAAEQYQHYQELKEQVEDNLTGDQDFNSIELKSEDDLKQALLEYAVSNNLVYEINKNGVIYYLVNADFQKNIEA